MDALITVSGFGDDDCAYDAVTGTALCDVTAGRLSSALDALDEAFSSDPFNVSHVEEIKVSWIEAHHLLDPQGRNSKDFAGKTELVAFFSWLDFCDDIIGKSHPVIRDSLVEAVEVQFFQVNTWDFCTTKYTKYVLTTLNSHQKESNCPRTRKCSF